MGWPGCGDGRRGRERRREGEVRGALRSAKAAVCGGAGSADLSIRAARRGS